MFDDGGMGAAAVDRVVDPALLDELRGRIRALEGGPARLTLPDAGAGEELVRLQAGGSYAVDAASLAMSLAAGASSAGEWVGFVGWDDFGAEAAAQLGVDLGRTVLVPSPGELWVEVVAALVDVMRLVVLRPPAQIDAKSASVLDARLRARSAALVVHGDWPRSEASIRTAGVSWDGLGQGAGRLHAQRTRILVEQNGPVRRREIVLGYAGPAGAAPVRGIGVA